MMERFTYWFAWLNLIGSTVGWAVSQVTTTEPPVIHALSWYAVWQGSLIFIVSAHVDKKRKEGEVDEG